MIRSLQGRTLPEEEAHLRAWRACAPENERRYALVRELWTLSGVAAPEPEQELPDVYALLAGADSQREAEESPLVARTAGWSGEHLEVRARRAGPSRTAVGVLAAGLVAVSFVVGTWVGGDAAPALLSQSEIVTGAAEMTTVTLGDGSSIRLGPRSRLRLGEEQGRRIARLDGRAFFGVQADSANPFTVHTEHGDAQVVGTRFEVRSGKDELRVLVVQGSVSVASGGKVVSLADGEMARAGGGGRLSVERVHDLYEQLNWLGNAIVFQGTRFDHALREIEQRYGVSISLEDPRLAEITVTATFTDQPIDEVIYVLCQIVNATCRIDDERIRIGTAAVRTMVGANTR